MTHAPGWLYNEFQQIGVDFEDKTQVEVFDRNQKSSTSEAEQALVERLGISVGHTVIDLGSGTGTFAVQAALAGAKVYAVDVSPVMLAYAQQKAEAIWIVERGRTSIPSAKDLLLAVEADLRVVIYPLDKEVIETTVSLSVINEMHDRQIAATALVLALKVR